MPGTVLNVKVGDEAVFTKAVSEKDIASMAEVSGDHNPLHLDPAYAARTRFGRVVAHGVLTVGLISAAIATHFAKDDVIVILLSANHKFRQPVYAGDVVTARARVRRFDPERGLVFLDTECANQRNEALIGGEVVILLDSMKKE